MENLVTLEGLLNRITDDLDAQPSQVSFSLLLKCRRYPEGAGKIKRETMNCLLDPDSGDTITREEVFMEGPIEPNMGPSLADVLLCTLESILMQGFLHFL
jgi:hypothetical protein